MEYIVCFGLSLMFNAIAINRRFSKNKVLLIFFSAVSILIPSVLAGCRDTSIGTDVEYYLVKDFKLSLEIDSFSVFRGTTYRELGYLSLVYMVANLTEDIHAVMFMITFIVMLNMYIGAYRMKDDFSMPLVLALFFLFYYNVSLNSMRQIIAVSFVFLGYTFLEKNKYKIFFVFIVIAMLFHTTAIIGILLFVIRHIILYSEGKQAVVYDFVMIAVVLFAVVFSGELIKLLVEIGVLDTRYLYYIAKDSVTDNLFLFSILLFEVSLIIFLRFYEIDQKKYRFYVIIAIFTLLVSQITRFMYAGSRINYYFEIINLLAFAMIPHRFTKGFSRILVSLFLVFFALVYWWYIFVYSGSTETYPYTSELLEIV